jgi:protein translocase SecG subunit
MVSLLLIGLILLQKNRGSGLSGAFGGVGGHTAFGTKTGDFLTWVTVSLAFVFLLMSVVANFVFDRQTITAENAPPPPAPTTPAIPPIQVTPSGSTGKATQTIPPKPPRPWICQSATLLLRHLQQPPAAAARRDTGQAAGQ